MDRVLITGGRAPVALDLARRFAAAGSSVFVADSTPLFLAGSSRTIARAFRVPPPRLAPIDFAAAIETIVQRHGIDLIVPTCEEVFYLARFADRLRRQAALFCPDFDTLALIHNKWRFTKLAAGLGVHVPETWLLEGPDDVAALHLPPDQLVFKPVFSRFAVHTLIRPAAGQISRLRPSPAIPWIAQHFIAGRELCSYSVSRDGRLAAHALYQPTWRAGLGSGFYFVPLQCPIIETFVSRLVADLRYTGQIAFDFIQSDDHAVYVLECNPRATSGVHLFSDNDPLPAAFANGATGVIRPSPGPPGMLAPAMVLLGFPQAVRHGRFRRLAADFLAARDSLWRRSDPLPALYLYLGLGAYLWNACRRGISPRAASTRDLEWDGQPIP